MAPKEKKIYIEKKSQNRTLPKSAHLQQKLVPPLSFPCPLGEGPERPRRAERCPKAEMGAQSIPSLSLAQASQQNGEKGRKEGE